MSAWYLFAAMGFYPVCPATNEYVHTKPLFKEVRINVERGER
jgi:putative alpha-1,2-mannosidase